MLDSGGAYARRSDLTKCRVCGYDYEDWYPWRESGDESSHDICVCCGIEFGHEDGLLHAVRAARQRWLDAGALWAEPRERAPDWDLDEQRSQIPPAWR